MQIAIVTGGSKGIGEAIVKLLETKGYHVFNLDLIPGEYGNHIECDMSNFNQVKQVITEICSTHKKVDALVCNAGIHLSKNIEQTSLEEFDNLFSINVKGAYAAIQATIGQMRQQGKGAIVLVASDQAVIGKQNSFAYNLSKHALASICKTTALDYAADNIRVNAVCPGTIETPLYHNAIDQYCAKSGADKQLIHQEEQSLQPLGRLGQPEEVAEYVNFLISEKAGFITGSLQMIDGGYTTG